MNRQLIVPILILLFLPSQAHGSARADSVPRVVISSFLGDNRALSLAAAALADEIIFIRRNGTANLISVCDARELRNRSEYGPYNGASSANDLRETTRQLLGVAAIDIAAEQTSRGFRLRLRVVRLGSQFRPKAEVLVDTWTPRLEVAAERVVRRILVFADSVSKHSTPGAG